jgi:pimeloyl-ACP methyl ester carboxylesterase
LSLILAAPATAALLALAGAIYQRSGRASDLRRFPPPGRLIHVGDTSLHVYAIPESPATEGSPPVAFEAGIAATSLSWQLVQPEIAKFTQTASYDRAGLGWSGPGLPPRTIWNVADEWRTLMDRADIPKPRVLVGHSYGALVAIAYAVRHPAEVAGMVLLDPVATCEWSEPSASHLTTLRRGVLLSRRGAWLARFGVVRLALSLLAAGSRRLPRIIARASSGQGTAIMDQLVGQVRKLPVESWPMIQSHWCDPKCFEGMARYLEALPHSASAVAQELGQSDALRDVPLIVLSAGNASPIQRAEHETLARRSSRGQIEVVSASGHWIQVDRPDVVIRAIRGMVARKK